MPLLLFFYNLFFPLVLVILLPAFIHRMVKRGKYRHKFGQRFGIYSSRVREKLSHGEWIWVHAVSVGEVMVAMKLLREMKEQNPGLQAVLSTTTSTGFSVARRQKSSWLEPIYNPLDFFWPVRRAMRLIRPRILILIEAEVWPNLIAEAKALKAPAILVNARLSLRSESRYRLIAPITALVFNQLDALCVQEEHDANRWIALGIKPKKIHRVGSIKFDDECETGRAPRDFQPVLREFAVPENSPVLLGGSTFSGEEKVLAQVFHELKKTHPDLLLILVPRHVERCPEILLDLEKDGFRVGLRNQAARSTSRPDILLVNTTGELRDWYACATVVFIGKSLCAKGGQNPMEAVAAGKTVLFGPNMQNFPSISRQLLEAGGAIEVKNKEELLSATQKLIQNPGKASAMAASAAECLAIHRGATIRTLGVISEVAKTPR